MPDVTDTAPTTENTQMTTPTNNSGQLNSIDEHVEYAPTDNRVDSPTVEDVEACLGLLATLATTDSWNQEENNYLDNSTDHTLNDITIIIWISDV